MSDKERDGAMGPPSDPGVVLSEVRQRIVQLGEVIDELRDEAADLRARADRRTALLVLEPPAELAESVDARIDESIDELGRHAANVPDEFDPRPFDPDEGGPAAEAAPNWPEAAPGFEAGAGATDAALPSLDVAPRRSPLGAPEPEAVLASEAAGDAEGADDAGVFGIPTDAEAGIEPPPPAGRHAAPPDDGPEAGAAFGVISSDEAAEPAAHDPQHADAGGRPGAGATDAELPEDWNTIGGDDDAFDKFFSSDVEPEPAQRWLLNE